MIQPYKHDCKGCKWVGWFGPWEDKPPMNVYLCGTTVVIRMSDDPPDYWAATAGVAVPGALGFARPEDEKSVRSLIAARLKEREEG